MVLKITSLILALAIYYLPVDSESLKFYMLTALLLIYSSGELFLLYKRQLNYFFISPIFLSSIVTFGLVFGGIVNFLLLSENGYIVKGFGYKIINEQEWLTKTMFLAFLACLSMWIGYGQAIGKKLFDRITSISIYKRLYESPVHEQRLIVVVIVAYIAKFYLFSIGLWGRIVDEKYFEAGVGFKLGSQIRILGELSYVTFFLISVIKFSTPSSRINILFFTSLILEVFFGFIYGARGPFITPFLIIFVAYYLIKRKINLGAVLLVGASVYLAFTIVYEFKNFVLSKSFSRTSSTVEVIENFRENQDRFVTRNRANYKFTNALDATLISVNFVPETAVAVRQKDKMGTEYLTNPSIIKTILLFPIDAFVPRFIQGQNEFAWGYWFKEEVIEINPGLKYSIAMSPIGFLYLGGGIILVIIGFWFYGVLLKLSYPFLLKRNLYAFLVYFMILSSLVNLDSVYSNALIYFTRYLIIFPILLWMIFDANFFRYWKS